MIICIVFFKLYFTFFPSFLYILFSQVYLSRTRIHTYTSLAATQQQKNKVDVQINSMSVKKCLKEIGYFTFKLFFRTIYIIIILHRARETTKIVLSRFQGSDSIASST